MAHNQDMTTTQELTMAFAPIALPDYTADENFAEVGTAAWIACYGGTDVTAPEGDEDYGTWVGDVDIDGTVYRLTVADDGRRLITAEER